MEGVEHLGQYVFEMTQAKVEMLRRGENVLPPQEAGVVEDEEMDGEEMDGEEMDGEEMDGEGGEVKVEDEERDESESEEIT